MTEDRAIRNREIRKEWLRLHEEYIQVEAEIFKVKKKIAENFVPKNKQLKVALDLLEKKKRNLKKKMDELDKK